MIRDKKGAEGLALRKIIALILGILVAVFIILALFSNTFGFSIKDFLENIWGEKNDTKIPEPEELQPIPGVFPESFTIRNARGDEEKFVLLDDVRFYFIDRFTYHFMDLYTEDISVHRYSIIEIDGSGNCKNVWLSREDESKRALSGCRYVEGPEYYFGFLDKFKEEKQTLGDFPEDIEIFEEEDSGDRNTLSAYIFESRLYLIETRDDYYVGEIYNDGDKVYTRDKWKSDFQGNKIEPEKWNIPWGRDTGEKRVNEKEIRDKFVEAQHE